MPLCEIVEPTRHPALLFGTTPKPEPEPADLLYLFACGLRWQNLADATAGWDLLAGLRSMDAAARALSASLLFQSRSELAVYREFRRSSWEDDEDPSLLPPVKDDEMITPYGLEMCESCVTCKLTKSGWFCHLAHEC